MFIASVGVEALTIVNVLLYARQEDRKDLVKILDLMERHCIGAESEAYERFKFCSRSQGDGEPFETFLTALRTVVRTCNFRKDSVDYSAEMIRDRIIMGIRDSTVRRRILIKNDADVDLCVKECRTSETTNRQTLDMATGPARSEMRHPEVEEVCRVGQRRETSRALSTPHAHRTPWNECDFCGRRHQRGMRHCPAAGQTCDVCGKTNHFASKCRSRRDQSGNAPSSSKHTTLHYAGALKNVSGVSDDLFVLTLVLHVPACLNFNNITSRSNQYMMTKDEE